MRSARLLLVEDEQIVRCLLAETLGDAGYEVTEAECGDEAAALFDDHPSEFDLLVTDVQMPGHLDGIALARHVRTVDPNLPIVFMTGRPDVMIAGEHLGPRDRFVRKPYGQSQMVTMIEGLLAGR